MLFLWSQTAKESTHISRDSLVPDRWLIESQSNFQLTGKSHLFLNYQVIWGSHWQDGSAASSGEEVEQINSHTSRCGNTTKYMLPESKCFATHGLLFANSIIPDRQQFKNELCFRLLHKFLTWHNLSNVLRFTLYVIIFFIIIIILISCCRLSCPATSSLLMHKHVRNLRDFFITGCSFF